MSEQSALDRGRLLSIPETIVRIIRARGVTAPMMHRATALLTRMPNEQLGKLLKEYLEASNHNSWDGWEIRDLRGAFALLYDFSAATRDGRLSETAKWEPTKDTVEEVS